MSDTLHIFALRGAGDVRHTHLTRAQGAAPDLPPLTDWLGAEVDTDEIEMFPITDLGEMKLSEYIRLAFAPDTISPQDARRIDAIKGTVLLVPERSLSEEPAPTAEARLIATLPLARADHVAQLPKALATRMTAAPPTSTKPRGRLGRGPLPWVMLGLGLLLLVVIWVL
jgi:hypothetical protein